MYVDDKELTQFNERMIKRMQDNPKEIKRFLRTYANTVKKDIKQQYQIKGVKKKTGNLLKGIKAGKVHKYDDYRIRVYSRAPHAHLIEDGHEIVGHKPLKKGTDKFTRAYHVLDGALKEGQYVKAVNKWVDTVLKKGWK